MGQPGKNSGVKAILEGLGGRNLVFVGLMGSGKTAIGRMVASALAIPYHDSDQEIVEAANMEIPEIFERHGEAYFRAGEERVIQRLLAGGPAVISLGGGAFMSRATREEIEQRGVSVWLRADLELLLERVLRRPGTRPLLNTGDPRETLQKLLETRGPVYALADIHVDSSPVSKAETRNAVLAALARHFQENHSRGSIDAAALIDEQSEQST